MVTQEGDDVRIVKAGPLGPFTNNSYVVIDPYSGERLIVDMPQEAEKILEAAQGTQVSRIVLTHTHPDQCVSYDLITKATGAPVCAHEQETGIVANKIQQRLADDDELALRRLRVRVIHTPGHTPGSICLLVGKHLIAGDTLFPGGPGHTNQPEELQQEIRSIVERLYTLSDDTVVYPGHGDNTTIGQSKREYAVFASGQHPSHLCGDVTWEGS